MKPIHVNTDLLHAHSNRLKGLANRLDQQRANLTNAVGLLTWDTSTPNHVAIIGAYNRALGLFKARADALRRLASETNKYAQVMAMIEANFAGAKLAAGLLWGAPASVNSGEPAEGFGAKNTFWAGWAAFDQMWGPLGLGAARVMVFPGITTLKLPLTTILPTTAGTYNGYPVALFNKTFEWVDHPVAQTLPLGPARFPWLPALSKFMAGVSIASETYGLLHPEHQDSGSKAVEQVGHAMGIGSGALIIAGLGATASATILTVGSIGVPYAFWQESNFERLDDQGRVPMLTSPLDAGLYIEHVEVTEAASLYFKWRPPG